MSQLSLEELTHKVAKVSDTYARRCAIRRDDDWYALKLTEEIGELNAEYLRLSGRGRSKGKSADEIRADLGQECADVLAHLLLFAKNNNIDLEKELRDKWFVYLDDHDK
ncbi:phosphoribosyl-ATP pyrophosphohydrolase [Maritalea porphyrae]|uniref:Pyrophosphatase n=1 Tax=Maritalea porphyrae TaxID=880732 RepID=A0ABQ5UVM7_9HYPH|nr:phosphoribosyl-ATP pyrophosphohydrolase [Maritalea porphyrae]GLQ18939.1 pyrophosphatase [Maritalea porphyrae]